MNFDALLKLKTSWNTFCANHPKFPDFVRAVKNKGICEGAQIDICITYPDGSTLRSGIRVKESDAELLHTLGGLG